ncbi:MAG: VOC family protein [Puniceicoccaceae bacterium]
MKKVTGIGGVFFKCKDPQAINQWYRKHLGFKVNEYGSLFQGREFDNPEKRTLLQWSPFDGDTDYFGPTEKDFMFNYRVENLEWLIGELKKEGIEIVDKVHEFPYGKFAHIMDPEGNKIELWEPIDEGLDSELESQK